MRYAVEMAQPQTANTDLNLAAEDMTDRII